MNSNYYDYCYTWRERSNGMVKFSPCDYSDAYILVKGIIAVTGADADASHVQILLAIY